MKKLVLIWLTVAMAFMTLWALDAQAQVGEILYLADSGDPQDGETSIFLVNLDSVTHKANLIPLPDAGYGPGLIPFEADAIAVSLDGKRIYALDKYDTDHLAGGKLGYYDVATFSWNEMGYVKTSGSPTPVPRVYLAAFFTDGELYVASAETDSLYKVNTSTAEATLIGQIVNSATSITVDVVGADIAFAEDGTLFLWTNGNKTGAPKGLYSLTLPSTIPGIVNATYLGKSPTDNNFYTGLAVRANGMGDLVGSNRANAISVLDKSNGSMGDVFAMYLGSSPYEYTNGDMTVGPLSLCTYTIGYWKNHSWRGTVALICGVPVDETSGKNILSNASSKDFSMLFAQLIGAKLNTNNSTGIPVIDNAEEWLCAQSGIITDTTLNWNKSFDSKAQKSTANGYSKALDDFNKYIECK